MKKGLGLALALALMLDSAFAIGSSTWYFPGGDTTHHFIVNPLLFPAQWTLETWIKPVASTSGTWWLSFATANSGSMKNCFVQSSAGLAVDKWHHVIMTWDGSTNSIYFDGVENPVGRHPATAQCLASSGSLTIGQEQDSVGGGFDANQAPNMYLDTVAIYSRAWSASEVSAKASNDCVDMNDPDIFAAWYTEDGIDQSGNGHTASVVPDATGGSNHGGVVSSVTTEGLYGYCADGTCFHGDGKVMLTSGNSKSFSELQIGDSIKTSDGKGAFSFNPVLTLPHARNNEPAQFLSLATESGKSVIMTPDHYIPTCDGTELTADALVVGDCLQTVDGKETLLEINPVEKLGVYTATTQEKYIVVDGIVASPYSKNSRRPDKWGVASRVVAYLKKHLRGSH